MSRSPVTMHSNDPWGSSIQEWRTDTNALMLSRTDGPAFICIHGPLGFTFMNWVRAGRNLRSVGQDRDRHPLVL